MSFSGLDDLVTKMANGQKQRMTANRIVNTGATSAAGRWHECFAVANGTGGIGVLTGTAGVGQARDASSLGALPISPVAVTPSTRHLLALLAVTPIATMVPGLVKAVDILYVYPSCLVTTGAGTVISNAAAKPARFNAGKDVKLGAIVAGVALGAAAPLITCTYLDQDGISATGFLSAPAVSLPIGTLLSGSAIAVLGSPEMIMAAGDSGVQQLSSYTTVSGGTTGNVTFFLYRDLGEVPLIAANLAGERDFLSQIPSLPTVDDNACLTALVLSGGALAVNSPILLTVHLAWG